MIPGNKYSEILFAKTSNKNSFIKCEICSSKNIEIIQKQIRSADEPPHVFKTCKDCGHVEVEN